MNNKQALSRSGGGASRKQRKQQNKSANAGQKISVPVAEARLRMQRKPKMSTTRSVNGDIIVQHSEYIADIPGSVAFASTTYNLNPGLQSVFAWLSSVAGNYESHRFTRLQFRFETMKSTATSGTVMIACDYDASDAAPLNKQQLMSYHNAVRSPVWGEDLFMLDVAEMYKLGPSKFIRLGNVPANSDVKLYDVGNLFVATDGCADTSALGELYVDYEVILQTPQTNLAAVISGLSLKVVAAGGSIALATPFGAVPVVTGSLPVSVTSSTITFNRVGQYLFYFNGTGTGVGAIPVLTGTAAHQALDSRVDSNNTWDIGIAGVNVTEVGQTLIVDWTGSATTITAGSYRLAAYDYTLL